MLPRAAPRPRAGACTLESSLRCLRTSDHRVLRGVLEIQENRPPPDDAGPALQEPASAYPEARMLPRAAPRPRAGACTLESSLRCLRTSDHRVLWGVLEIQENRPPPDDAGPALQEPASAYPETRMLPRAAPRPRAGACTLEFPLRCLRTSDHRVLRGVLKIQENRPPPDDAGPALQEPASAYPETRMLPRAAPRPRAGACTLESSLRCLRTSDHRVLRGGVLEIRENRPPPDDAGPALQEPASAYPEARMLPRAAPRPRAGACTLESSLRCLRTSDHRVLRGGVLEIRENRPPPDDAGPALQEPASACPEARMLPRAAPRPRAGACTLESPLRCLRTSDHRVLRGVLEIQENRPPPDDARPALQEPASACPEARMLPRAAPRPRAGACTLESSLRCLRTSDDRVLRGVLEIREN
jgi:hypothetical protein